MTAANDAGFRRGYFNTVSGEFGLLSKRAFQYGGGEVRIQAIQTDSISSFGINTERDEGITRTPEAAYTLYTDGTPGVWPSFPGSTPAGQFSLEPQTPDPIWAVGQEVEFRLIETRPPLAPAVTVTPRMTGEAGQLDIAWTPADNTGRPAVTVYKVRYRLSSVTEWMEGMHHLPASHEPSIFLASLETGAGYDVQMRAVNIDGDGPWSATATGNASNGFEDVAIWSATMTTGQQQVGGGGPNPFTRYGYGDPSVSFVGGSLSSTTFNHGGQSYTVRQIYHKSASNTPAALVFELDRRLNGKHALVFSTAGDTRVVRFDGVHSCSIGDNDCDVTVQNPGLPQWAVGTKVIVALVLAPTVSVAAVNDSVTEGESAEFAVTASRAPIVDLPVTLTIAAAGEYGVDAGNKDLVIPAGQTSAIYDAATTDDDVDAEDGTVTATLAGSVNYDIAAGSATVGVTNDDDAPPTVSIAANQVRLVFSGDTVQLRGTASDRQTADADLTIAWTQTGGTPSVALTGANTVTASFTAPNVTANTDLTFRLTVTDGGGSTATADVTITIGQGFENAIWRSWLTAGSRDLTYAIGGTATRVGFEDSGGLTERRFSHAGTYYVAEMFYDRNRLSSGGQSLEDTPLYFYLSRRSTGNSCPVDNLSGALVLAIRSGGQTTLLRFDGASGRCIGRPAGQLSYSLPNHGLSWSAGDLVEVALLPPPTLSIAAVEDTVLEEAPVRLRVTADRAPLTDLPVTLNIAVVGNYGIAAGNRDLVIPAGQTSVNYNVNTLDDNVRGSIGSVTATLVDTANYNVAAAPANAAQALIHDTQNTLLWDANLDSQARPAGVRDTTGYFTYGGSHIRRGSLTPNTFSFRGATYSVSWLASSGGNVTFTVDRGLGLGTFVLTMGGNIRTFQGSDSQTYNVPGSFQRDTSIRVTLWQSQGPPVFNDGGAATRSIDENAGTVQSPGAPIGDPVTANDPNPGQAVTYSLGGTNAASFTLNAANGQISTRAGVNYDHEAKDSYSVTVTATDDSGNDDNSADIDVTINVNDVAEPPLAPGQPSLAAQSETSLSVTVTPPDNTGRPSITGYRAQYRVNGSGDAFTLSDADSAAPVFDISNLQANKEYEVQARAVNADGNGAWSASGTGSTDAPPGPPTFSVDSPSVNEGSDLTFTATLSSPATGVSIVRYALGGTALEADPGRSIIGDYAYSTATPPQSNATRFYFATGASEATITFTTVDDPFDEDDETVVLTLSSPRNVTLAANTATGTIIDNDGPLANNAPVFAQDSTSRSIAETVGAAQDAGRTIGAAVTATDADNDALTYSLEGTDAASFEIVAASGQLRTKVGETYDREAKASYSVTVKATDPSSANDTIDVTIDITNVSEPPLAPGTPTVAGVTTTQITVRAAPPDNTGRPAITGYRAQYRVNDSGDAFTLSDAESATPAFDISNLQANTEYEVQARAVNADGNGAWSASGTGSMSAVPTVSVTALPAEVDEGQDVTFTVTADPLPLANLLVTVNITAEGAYGVTPGHHDLTLPPGSGRASFLITTTDNPAITPHGSVTATVAAGVGYTVGTSTVVVRILDGDDSVPDAPATPAVTADTATSVSVRWNVPSGSFSVPTGYDLRYRLDGDPAGFTAGPQNVSGTTALITGLAPSTAYEAQARARNKAGVSGWSDTGRGSTGAPPVVSGTIPDASVIIGDDHVVDAATYFTGTVDTYTADSSDDTKATVAVTGSTVTVTGVAAGTATITVTATNSGGMATQTFDITVTARGITLVTDPPTTGPVYALTVTEGGTETYTVVLDTQPAANVTVTPGSSNEAIATVSGPLTFTASDWSTAQTVTVTGVNSAVNNGVATIFHTVAGVGYSSMTAAAVDVTVTARSITLVTDPPTTAPDYALTVTDGGMETYTVVLDTQPAANVTVTPESSNTAIATVSGPLTFTASDWSTAQTVTVNGVSSFVSGGVTTIFHTVAGVGYSSTTADVDVTVTARGITLVTDPPTTGPDYALTVAENADTETYTVVLDTQPTADVTVALVRTGDSGAATLSTPTLTFTTGNWNVAQTVTVTGVNDDIDNAGDERTLTITHTANGGGYVNVAAALAVTVTDDDTEDDIPDALDFPDVTAPAGTSVTSDPATIAGINVPVRIALSVVPSNATFTCLVDRTTDCAAGLAAVSAGQTVTLTATPGANDGDTVAITVTLGEAPNAVSSTWTLTTGGVPRLPAPQNLTAAWAGNDKLFLEWDALTDALSYLVQWRAAGENYNAETREEPVTDPNHVISGLTPGTAYTLRVAGVVQHTAGVWSNEVTTSTTTVTIAGGQTVPEGEPSVETRTGSTLGYTLTFSSAITEPVTVYFAYVKAGTTAQSNQDFVYHVHSEVVSSGPLFDALQSVDLGIIGKWEIPASAGSPVTTAILPVTVYGDYRFEADETVQIRLLGVTNAALGSTLTATNTIQNDDALPEIIVGESRSVYEGNTIEVDVYLSAASETTVTVQYHDLRTGTAVPGGSGTGDYPLDRLGTEALPKTLTFPPATRDQTVSIWAKSDDDVEGDETIDLRFHSAMNATLRGADGSGNLDVTATILDEDLRPIITVTSGAPVAVGADAEFILIAQPTPTTDVTVHMEIDATAGYVDPANLGGKTVIIPANQATFTYSVATIDGDATSPSGAVRVTLQPDSAAATPATASYTRGAAYEATVTVGDNESPAVIVSEAVLTVDENGGEATYTIKLNGRPNRGNVTVTRYIDDTSVVDVSPGSVTFGTSNWNTPQTFTVTGVNDNIDNPNDQRSATITHAVTTENSGFYEGISINSGFVIVTDDDDAAPLPVITVTAVNPSVTEGQPAQFTLTATPSPDVALTVDFTLALTGNYVTGISSGPKTRVISTSGALTFSIATIDDTAVETDGSVTVTLTDGNGYTVGDPASAEVTVNDNDVPAPVAAGTIPAASVAVNATQDVDVSGAFTGTGITYTASSSATDKATVTVSGPMVTVTGVAVGTATITVTATNTGGSVDQTFVVTVTAAPPVASGTIDDITIVVSTSRNIDVASYFSGTVDTYTVGSSDATVVAAFVTASTSNITLTSFRIQTTVTITVTATNTGGSVDQTFEVTVGPAAVPVAMGTIPDASVVVGEAGYFVNAATYFTGTVDTYTASSSDDTKATVSVAATFVTVTGVAAGTAEITVTATNTGGSVDQTFTVTVTAAANQAPVFTDGPDATREVPENSGANVNVGAAVAATDPENDLLSYSLGGTDAGSFDIDGGTGQIKTKSGVTYDYEMKSSYSVRVSVAAAGGDDNIDVTINLTDVNDAPVFTEGPTATREFPENTAAGTDIGNPVTATDQDRPANTLSYTLSGTDGDSFSIVQSTGQLTTKSGITYDFEAKSSYSVMVSVSDGRVSNNSDSIAVTINLTDVAELPDAPVASGSIDAVSVAVGAMQDVDVSGAFTGTVDSYTAVSDATDKATVAVSGSTVTVTGVAVGTATITVTATNGGGSAEQTFVVTVTARTLQSEADGVTVYVRDVPAGKMLTVGVLAGGHASRTAPAGKAFASGPVEVNLFPPLSGETVSVCLSGTGDLARHNGTQWDTLATTPETINGGAFACADVTAFSPFAVLADAAPTGRMEIWSATLTVGNLATAWGYQTAGAYGALSPNTFRFNGTDYTVSELNRSAFNDIDSLNFQPGSTLGAGTFTLSLGGVENTFDGEANYQGTPAIYHLSASRISPFTPLTFTSGTVEVILYQAAATTPPMASGTIPAVSVAVGAAHYLGVAPYFTGTVDTYAASSSDITTATVEVTGSTVTVTGVAERTATITVTATNDDGSAEQTFMVTVKRLFAPENLTAVWAGSGLGLEWDAVTNADSYVVQWKSGGESYDEATRQADAAGTSHVIAGLTNGTSYTLRVAAVDNIGDGPWSDEVTTPATPASTVTIAGGISVDEGAPYSGERQSALGYTLTFSPAITVPVTVYYSSVHAGSTARYGQDFTYRSERVLDSGPLFDALKIPETLPAVSAPVAALEIDASAGSPVTTAHIVMTIQGDSVHETDETVQVRLLGASNATLGSTIEATNTIVNDDEPAEIIVIEPRPIFEGHMINMEVRLSAPSETEITLDYEVLDTSTAVPGGPGAGDYPLNALPGGTLTFAPHATVQTLNIWAKADDEVEGDETINLRFSNPVGAALRDVDGSGNVDVTAIILDEDSIPLVTITGGPPVAVGDSAQFTVIADPAPTTDMVVNLYITATAGYVADAELGAKSVTIPANQATATYSVATIDDVVSEPRGTVAATLASGDRYTRGSPNTAAVIVGELAPAVIVSEAVLTVAENGGTASYTIKLNSPPPADVQINILVTGDTGAVRVSPRLRTVNRTSWESTYTVTITGINDDIDNPNDRRSVTITHTVDAWDVEGNRGGVYDEISVNSVFVIVTDDDAPSTVPDAPAAPNVTSVQRDNLYVTWAAPSNAGRPAITHYKVRYRVNGVGSFTEPDLNLPTSPLNVNLNMLMFDTEYEVQMQAVNADGASPWSVSGTGTTGAAPTVTLTLTPADINESGTGNVSTVTVAMNVQLTQDVTVDVSATAVSPAVAGDFTLSGNTTLTITKGQTISAGAVTITAVDNSVDAVNKTVTVSGTSTPATLTVTAATLTITDDDAPAVIPVITIAAGTSPVTEGTAATFTVTASPVPTANLDVSLIIDQSGDYVAAGDLGLGKTVTILANAATATYAVATIADSVDEINGSVTA